METKNNVKRNDLLRKSIMLLIEMRRNLMEYQKVFNVEYSGSFEFVLNGYSSGNSDNLEGSSVPDKIVRIGYNHSDDTYQITTIFDGTELTNSVPTNRLPLGTIVTLLELFPDIESYRSAFQQFIVQQELLLEQLPVSAITDRVIRYLQKNPDTTFSIKSGGMESLITFGDSIVTILDGAGIERTFFVDSDVAKQNFIESLDKFGFTYYSLYTDLFFNIRQYNI